jgi:Flp pilus assembly protein TadG
MQRLNEEHGAVSVLVAVLLVGFIGAATLTVDVGNLYWERRSLQNGADAAALAAAQDFASGSPGTARATADDYADANNERGAFVEEFTQPTANSVMVTARTGDIAAPGQLNSILAGVLGVDEYFTRATATATWGSPGSANTIPLTFSYCEWQAFTGGLGADGLPTDTKVIYHHTSSASDVNDCDGPAGQDSPGGFGWLDEESPCAAYVENGEVDGDTGASMSGDCKDSFPALLGQTVLMPIFVEVTGTGAGAVYEIIGFAAFEFEGYRFPSAESSPRPCSPPETCVSGRFVEYYDLGAEPSDGPMDFGAYVVALTG